MPQETYVSRTSRLLRDFDGSAARVQPALTVRHGVAQAAALLRASREGLTEHGYVEQETFRGLDRPYRKEYRITAAGQGALRNWLLTPLPAQDTRIAELIQVFFAGQLSDEEVLALFELLAASARAALAAYNQTSQPADADVQAAGLAREGFFWQLTLEYGIMAARMDLEWCESVIARIKAGGLPPAPTAS